MKKTSNNVLIYDDLTCITRICKKCGIPKPLLDFCKKKQCEFGRTYTCYDCTNTYSRDQYLRRKDRIIQTIKKYRSSKQVKLTRKNYQTRFKEMNPNYYKSYHKQLRELENSICIWHYSRGMYKCLCCNLNDGKIFLQIDHINNNSKKEERTQLARLLIKRNLPDGFQILCGSCNHAKFRNKGICPHIENREVII